MQPLRLPHRHAHGALITKNVRWRETRARIHRWCKRVVRRVLDKQTRQDNVE